jgi:sarcosine oxidase subunit alpha
VEWIRYHTKEEDWDFHLVNLTDALCAVNLAGPRSRDILSRLTEADLSNEAFPYLGYREISIAGFIPARVMRVGFVGELAYEIHAPASMGETLWARLMEAGREFDIRPFGLEAQNVLRLEKGHVIIGQESEIRTNLHDLGMSWLWARNKTGAKKVGAPALRFQEGRTGRLRLVGIRMEQDQPVPPDGSLVVDDDIKGHICTVRYSRSLDSIVGLALVRDYLAETGTRLSVFTGEPDAPRPAAVVVETPFYDPDGARLRS